MTGPYDRPPAPATDSTDVPASLPEQMPGGDDTGPLVDPPMNPDLPGMPDPTPTDTPDTPGLPSPLPAM